MDLTPLLGPTGVAVVALIAVGALWREHQRADADDRAQRDQATAIAKDAVAGLARMADAWEQRNREDASRRRLGDS